MNNVGIYYRVSTDKQDLASQETAMESWLRDLSESKKPKSVRVFKDEGISGKTTNRPAYNELLQAAFAGEIDTILVYRLDRFSRDSSSAIRTILELDHYGVAFVSISQATLNLAHDNPFRRTFLAMFADLAEIERDTIVARVKAGLDAARKRGVRLGNTKEIPSDAKDKVIELRKKGESYRDIARKVSLSVGAVHKLANS
ncbi:PinR Site-specific recombinases, DNA invertase Pin homologs [uncultured Caudovirales phage]|uniref:PinR Site-specific recombinases, DNA invertase Pin homologs n=1 Tax=uncultured Caudovirales phage TaxID=2100421 RepID=A0A6J7WTE7_9CAUD|nr:PinR Site-specific recombinases, DNA invertase Pin homologs [uncultured Caudovirales phage]